MNGRNFAKYRFFLLPLFLLLTCVSVLAQQNSLITGTVLDKEGAAIPSAQVSLTDIATGYVSKTESNANGYFSFPALNIGTYDLKVSAKGFQTSISKGLVLNVSQTLRVDPVMTVGSVEQTVTVEADALAVQSDSNVVSTLISAEQISELATENRNFAALVALGLGVSSLLPDSNTPTSVASSFSISVNGLRQSHNIWLIDGGEADDRGGAGGMDIMPSQDAIAQVETLSSNYPPDYGISSGATMSLGLKSGTQKFHGTLFEFNRNTAFNANSFFNKQANPVKNRSKLNYNIFGFNIGGPLYIPGVYNTNKQKTFFFWNEEWRRLIQGSSPNQQNALAAADFPTAGQNLTYVAPAFASTTVLKVPTVGDPVYNAKLAALGLTPGQAFPGNVIPSALFDPNAVLYLNSGLIPKPNTAAGYNIGSATLPINVRDDVVRIDHRFNEKWQVLAHYLHDSVTQGNPSAMLGWSGSSYNTITSTLSNPSNSAAVKLTGTVTPNLLVEASMNYDGNIIDIVNSANGNLPSGWSANKYFANGAKSMPGVRLGTPYGTNELPGSAPWHNAAEDYSPKLDVSYTQGKHAMKFGLSYNRYTKNQKLFLDSEGDYSFGTLTGDSAMDLLLGLASGYSESQIAPIRHYVNQTTSAYVMDTWHVTPRLSLQLGLRYDALPHAFERANQVANFNPEHYLASLTPVWNSNGTLDQTGPGFTTPAGASQPFYLNGMDLAGQNGVPVGLVTNDYKTLQPRVGFSEDLFGDGKTVLRGGFGTFFERLQGNDIYNAATAPPFANTPSATNVYMSNPHTSYVTGSTAALPFFAQGVTSLAHIYRAPAVAQYSLGIQRQLVPSVVMVVQYVGNLAWHQNINRNINNYSLNTPLAIRANAGDPSNHAVTCNTALPVTSTNCPNSSLPNGNIYRTFQGFSGINQQENTTNGGYNGFQTGIRAQNKWGLSGELDYTYSHEIDLTSGDLANIANPYNLKYDKGSGSYDRRHILSANYIYKLPIFNTGNGLTHSVLGGWEVAGTAIFQTGTPVVTTLSANYDPIGLGGGYTNRPNINGKVNYTKTLAHWYDRSVLSAPTPVWQGGANQGFGNLRRDAIVGPGRVNFTTSIYKSFAITERARFEFRAESFNTFNHTEFNGLSSGAGFNASNGVVTPNGNVGAVTSTYDPRALEFGGKLIF